MRKSRLIPLAAMGYAVAMGSAWAATGSIAAAPNPCRIAPGAHDCTTFVKWSTKGAKYARVFVRAEGKGGIQEREFGAGAACVRCAANWMEAGSRYIFTLVDYSGGSRGPDLASVTVTAVHSGGAAGETGSGSIAAIPNPCRLQPGKTGCSSSLKWSSEGVAKAGVFVTAQGRRPSPEKEFGSGLSCEKCPANGIEAGTRYRFILYDFSTGSRGRALASVVVTSIQ